MRDPNKSIFTLSSGIIQTAAFVGDADERKVLLYGDLLDDHWSQEVFEMNPVCSSHVDVEIGETSATAKGFGYIQRVLSPGHKGGQYVKVDLQVPPQMYEELCRMVLALGDGKACGIKMELHHAEELSHEWYNYPSKTEKIILDGVEFGIYLPASKGAHSSTG